MITTRFIISCINWFTTVWVGCVKWSSFYGMVWIGCFSTTRFTFTTAGGSSRNATTRTHRPSATRAAMTSVAQRKARVVLADCSRARLVIPLVFGPVMLITLLMVMEISSI